MVKKSPTDLIYNDLKEKYNKAIETMAQEVAVQIEYAYENAISLFYADYGPNNGEPWYYVRTGSTYKASSGYDELFPNNLQHYGDSWFAGIGVSPMNIPGHPYRADTGWVFNRTFNKGIHGIIEPTARRRNTTLIRKHLNFYKRYFRMRKKIQVRLPNGMHLINIRSTLGMLTIYNLPKQMEKPPKKIMDQQFRKITTKKNLDNLFGEIISQYIQ